MRALNLFRNVWYSSPNNITYIQGKVFTGSNNIKSHTKLPLTHSHVIALESYSDTRVSQNMHAMKLDFLGRLFDKIRRP
jgi:hypothetical protein